MKNNEKIKTFNTNKLLYESALNEIVHQELFKQWLKELFTLNQQLSKEYNRIYQKYFYVIFYELMTTGIEYSEGAVRDLSGSENIQAWEFYNIICIGLKDLNLMFDEVEMQYIEYRRHGTSHIFQTHYEYRIDNKGNITTERKKKSIDVIDAELKSLIIKHGDDKKFGIYMTSKLYPKIIELYNKIENQQNKNGL
jgi:hypothetical protein